MTVRFASSSISASSIWEWSLPAGIVVERVQADLLL